MGSWSTVLSQISCTFCLEITLQSLPRDKKPPVLSVGRSFQLSHFNSWHHMISKCQTTFTEAKASLCRKWIRQAYASLFFLMGSLNSSDVNNYLGHWLNTLSLPVEVCFLRYSPNSLCQRTTAFPWSNQIHNNVVKQDLLVFHRSSLRSTVILCVPGFLPWCYSCPSYSPVLIITITNPPSPRQTC